MNNIYKHEQMRFSKIRSTISDALRLCYFFQKDFWQSKHKNMLS